MNGIHSLFDKRWGLIHKSDNTIMNFIRKPNLAKSFWLIVFLFFIGTISRAQVVGDFRSLTSGNWATASSWQIFNGTSWDTTTSYPGQNAGNYNVTIQAGHIISSSGISTQPMGMLTISGILRLNGNNSPVNFFFNTQLIYITPNLSPYASIDFFKKTNLILPVDAVLRVWSGGLIGNCNNNQEIQIGSIKYAVCEGGSGPTFTFEQLMAAGGTLNSVGTIPPKACQGSVVQLQGGYTGAIGTPVTYNWSSSGPAVLTFSPSNINKDPTITPTVAGAYSITLTVNTKKDNIQIYSNTESSTLIVAPTSSVTNAAICEGDSHWFNGVTYNTTGTYNKLLKSTTSGCDSTAILNLTVTETSSVIKDTICEGEKYYFNGKYYENELDSLISLGGICNSVRLQLHINRKSSYTLNDTICSDSTYPFHGNIYNTSGSYTVILLNAAKCDSIVTLNLTVLSPASVQVKDTCLGNLPFIWRGKSLTESGIYRDTIQNVNKFGCDSIVTLALTVRPTTYSNTPVSVCQKDLPYIWNTKSYTQSGIFKDTLVNSVGCDSIATYVLTVNLPTFSFPKDTVCSKDLPYTWDGRIFTQAETYVRIKDVNGNPLKNVAGCDSTATYVLTVNLPTFSFPKDTICSSALPYTWDGLTFTGAGTKVKNGLTNTAGCDSTATFELTVKLSTSSLYKDTICSSTLPYTWDGLTFTGAETQTKSLINAAGCDSTATFKLTVKLSTSSTTTDSICSTNSSYSWNGDNYTFAGTYSKKFVNSIGCDSIATLVLIPCAQASDPSCPITVSDINACPNTNAQLTASGADYYFWTPFAGLSNATIPNPIVNVATTTNYSVTAFTEGFNNLIKNGDFENGNQDFTSDYAYTDTDLGPEGVYAVGPNPNTFHTAFSICGDNTPGTGKNMLIVNGNTTANSKIWGQTITVQANKYYAFYAYVTPVHISNPPIIQFSINGIVLGTPFASPAITCGWNKFYAIWYSGATTSADISIVNQNTIASGNDFAIDDIRYVDLCKTVDTVTVTVGKLTSTTNDTICSSELPFTWNGKTYNSAGTYSVPLISSVGCDSVATLNLTVNPTPTVTNTTLTQTICSGTSTTLVTLTSGVASTTFEWTASTVTAITGFTTSGTNTIPAQTLTNPDNLAAGTVTYVITPKTNSCTGTSVNYVVTVNAKPITSDIYHQ